MATVQHKLFTNQVYANTSLYFPPEIPSTMVEYVRINYIDFFQQEHWIVHLVTMKTSEAHSSKDDDLIFEKEISGLGLESRL